MEKSVKGEEIRPWGFYEVLSDMTDHKVKRVTVYPGKRMSLQKHLRRAEHWHIVKGSGQVILKNRVIPVSEGSSVDIGVETPHRIINTGKENLIFIEVQTGDYFGEDDIIRLEDDFGRA